MSSIASYLKGYLHEVHLARLGTWSSKFKTISKTYLTLINN